MIDETPNKYSMVYNHKLLITYVPSAKVPHINAIEASGLLDELTPEQAAKVVVIAQTAYQNGCAVQGAEKIDNDAVWVNGIGGIERQPDGAWILSMPDKSDASIAAAALGSKGGSVTSKAKASAARENGRKGGRPRKAKNE